MTKKDYFKPTYICGIYNGAETGTEGWGNMACSCVSYGNTYEEVIHNYMDNVKKVYPFFDFKFAKRNNRWLCDGRVIVGFRLLDCFLQGVQNPYRIGDELVNESEHDNTN